MSKVATPLTGEGFQKGEGHSHLGEEPRASSAGPVIAEPYQAARLHPNTHMVRRTVTRSTDQPGGAHAPAKPSPHRNGAPRPMKMGTTRSTWRYDGTVGSTIGATHLRSACPLHYAICLR